MLLRSSSIFVLLFIITFTEPLVYLPNLRIWTDSFFEQLVLFSAHWIFQMEGEFTHQLTSDSTGAFIHTFNLFCLALIFGFISGPFLRQIDYGKVLYWFRVLISYYLALQLFLYGFNKVFKCQFFLPEPNTLFTTVGDTPRDLLFWSVMGSSYSYTVFGGVLEILAGGLLLFRKTRLLGALMTFGIMSNVVAINFGFNISVKLYSCFFLLLSLMLLAPHSKQLYAFFIEQKFVTAPLWQPTFQTSKKRLCYKLGKTAVIWLLLFEGLAPYFVANNFNDDLQQRPPFHGAYEVGTYIENGMPFPPVLGYNFRWKRAFVHRRGYFIVQTMDDKMQDFHFHYDLDEQVFLLEHSQTKENYIFEYTPIPNQGLLLEGEFNDRQLKIRLNKLDLKELALLQNEFHWTIDAIK